MTCNSRRQSTRRAAKDERDMEYRDNNSTSFRVLTEIGNGW